MRSAIHALSVTSSGPSRQWRVRASDELYDATEQAAKDLGITVSELVRRATAEYVHTHRRA